MKQLMSINILFTNAETMRYATAGDYGETPTGWWLQVVQTTDWRHSFLVTLHELCELALLKHHNISITDVDDFDMNGAGKDHPDPGSLTNAPYHTEHVLATQIEKKFAKYLGVDWKQYNEALDALEYT